MSLRTYAKGYLPIPFLQTLRAARYRYDVWSFPRRVVSHRYGKHAFKMHLCDRVAREWYDHDWDEPAEMPVLRSCGLAPGALVFDLGAHQCLVAMMMARDVGPSGKVVAVEASRHNTRIAELNLAENGVTNVTVLQALISSTAGKELAAASLNSRKSSGGTRIGSDLVDALTVDDLSERYGWPDLVYVDIEGSELEALKGASATLARRSTWFVELHGDETIAAYGGRNSDVLAFFPATDYARYVCAANGRLFRPLQQASDLPRERCFALFVPAVAAH